VLGLCPKISLPHRSRHKLHKQEKCVIHRHYIVFTSLSHKGIYMHLAYWSSATHCNMLQLLRHTKPSRRINMYAVMTGSQWHPFWRFLNFAGHKERMGLILSCRVPWAYGLVDVSFDCIYIYIGASVNIGLWLSEFLLRIHMYISEDQCTLAPTMYIYIYIYTYIYVFAANIHWVSYIYDINIVRVNVYWASYIYV